MATINRSSDVFGLAHDGTGHFGAVIHDGEIKILGLFGSDFAGGMTVPLPTGVGADQILTLNPIGPALLTSDGTLWTYRYGKKRWFRGGSVLAPPARKQRIPA